MKKEAKNYDLTKVLGPEHAGKWVALSADSTKVVGYSDNLVELEKKVGRIEVVYMKAPLLGVSYAF